MAARAIIIALFALAAAGVSHAQPASCPSSRIVVDIAGGTTDQEKRFWRDRFVTYITTTPNLLVRLGPDVDFDFSDFDKTKFPIAIRECVTITSVAQFDTQPVPEALAGAAPTEGRQPILAGANRVEFGPFGPPAAPPARTSHSLGPKLSFGKHPDITDSTAFLEVACGADGNHDGVRLSGFRVFGNGDQTTDNVGLRIGGCHDVEVSNMEFAYFGGVGVEVGDPHFSEIPPTETAPILVLVHDNYIHDNKHPTQGGPLGGILGGGHAGGYGVNVALGGWAKIYNNTLDNNRHDITANGKAGGYDAEQNLVLKGGGYHGAWYEQYIHVFDAHGTDNCDTPSSSAWNCGDAGRTFHIIENAFQYTKTTDIKFRGKPKGYATISGNVFALGDQDSAVDGNDNVYVQDNTYGQDGYGQYQVCDFDGDGIDDLFLSTGVSWWFSGQARFPWTHLRASRFTGNQIRLGYFDGDERCDVLVESPAASGLWFISSGGTTDPMATSLGNFGHPLGEVRFGRFDPNIRDHRPGVTRQTTYAFWRSPGKQWWITRLTKPAWTMIGGSGFPLTDLAFGDFTGDGVTDVLAVEQGHWAISDAGRGQWRNLNLQLSDPVSGLVIANMDSDDNIDDILKLDREVHDVKVNALVTLETVKLTWWRSKNGVEPWKVWSTYSYTYSLNDPESVPVAYGFAGRFGPAAGHGAAMVIDQTRYGQFFADPNTRWSSEFPF